MKVIYDVASQGTIPPASFPAIRPDLAASQVNHSQSSSNNLLGKDILGEWDQS